MHSANPYLVNHRVEANSATAAQAICSMSFQFTSWRPQNSQFCTQSAHTALGICAGSMATSGMITGHVLHE